MSKKHTVRSYYDQYAPNYDNFYYKIQHDKFQHISPYLNVSPYLLDLGGGSGIVTRWIETPLINLDISISMLRSGLSKGSFLAIAADLEHLPFRRGSITNFVSLTAYQNTSDLSTAIADLKRIISSESNGVITLLRKTIQLNEIISIFNTIGVHYEQISFSGEDYCFIIHL